MVVSHNVEFDWLLLHGLDRQDVVVSYVNNTKMGGFDDLSLMSAANAD